MSANAIKEGDPAHAGLLARWKDEKRPARLVAGNTTYQCVNTLDNKWEFRPMSSGQVSDEMLSTSH